MQTPSPRSAAGVGGVEGCPAPYMLTPKGVEAHPAPVRG